MAKPGQSSFRRILLSRLLLLSVPVLLAGVYVTYRTARKTLLETARQNLIESAGRKGEKIQDSIDALRASLVTASENVVLQSPSKLVYEQFVAQLAKQLPIPSQCVQLINLNTKAIAASTCGNQPLSSLPERLWSQKQQELLPDRSKVYITTLLPPNQATGASNKDQQLNSSNQLNVVLSAPIYDSTGQLQYALSIQTSLLQQQQVKRGSLSGHPVVINQAGIILAHPVPQRIGRNISQEVEAWSLQEILKEAIAGRQDFEHLFSFEQQGVELLAGYTAIKSPVTDEANQKWVILAVTSLDSALAGLKDIQQVLFILTCGLIAASFLVTVYVARDLARPLEKLTGYALNQSQLHSTDPIPHNFKIREFNQLSEAFEGLIKRLKDWAEELETAWQEAQTANQLKNEFLANTSHELRTPLNGIIGCLRLVRDGFCDSKEEELDFLQRADDAAIHLLGIINDVLDIAKIEAGKLSVELEPIDLQKLLNEVINFQAVPIQQKGLEFYTPEFDEVIAVRADPAKLKQVLLNVIGNAVKFTDSGSITISTRLEEAKATQHEAKTAEEPNLNSHGLQVVVTIQDTGIGIDPTQQHKLFRPFVMVDGSTTRKCGGTGLGLAISRNLIEMMGGSITLFSDGDDKGTTVDITLPTIEPSLLLSGDSSKSNNSSQMSTEGLDTDDFKQMTESSQLN
ncbi:MAG: two-component sensor histidine kinase [Coleofasciculus sp. Co-bin14]|nr:two-component sensor histidine kinase [Coleofasciculus sp. Co-bin14]